MSELIRVMAAKHMDQVVLWERHPKHPGGEVFIKGDGTSSMVYPTPQIAGLIESGNLLKVQQDAPPPSEPVEGYDSMTATEIVALLDSLTDDEAVAVLEYETANKARKTILDALNGGNTES